MIATIAGLVVSVYMGIVYDELGRMILDMIFTGLFIFLFRRFFNWYIEGFFWISVVSFIPYVIWYVFDAVMPASTRYDALTLVKFVPIFFLIIIGLDATFRLMRNRTL